MAGKKRFLQFAITVFLVALGALGMSALKGSKPQIKKEKPAAAAPVVRTIMIHTGLQSVLIRGEGTVRPLREINLFPQVGGKVVYLSPSVVNGGYFMKNDLLLRIEQIDYKLAVTLAESKIRDSESKLKLAEEEAAAAKEEWRLYWADGTEANEQPPPLVAKEPQLAAARARLAADGADLEKAFLNLERTELMAPFDGRVSQETIDVGQYVSPGQSLAALYATDTAEIVLPLDDEDLSWFNVPGFTPGEGPGSSAMIRSRVAGREMVWQGQVVRSEGKLDARTRMINVVIRVKNPYAEKPPLVPGLFVTAEIKGTSLPDIVVVPRAALHPDNVIWVVKEDGRLYFRTVAVARFHGESAWISSGLKDGEIIVTSPLKAVSNGMAVRAAPMEEKNGT